MMNEATFKARLESDPDMIARDIKDGKPVTEANVLVACFNVPDTGVAVGNTSQQIIDPGSFREAIEIIESGKTFPWVLDHGDAMFRGGHIDSFKRAGSVKNLTETSEGALANVRYNLATQAGKEAASWVAFDKDSVRASFRWRSDEIVRGRDNLDHVVMFHDFVEFSQLPAGGAQAGTRVINARSEALEERIQHLRKDLHVPTQEEFELLLDDDVFRALATEFMFARHAFHGDMTPKQPGKTLLREWLKDEGFAKTVKDLLGIKEEVIVTDLDVREEEGVRSEEQESVITADSMLGALYDWDVMRDPFVRGPA
jgi:hypothetical protein